MSSQENIREVTHFYRDLPEEQWYECSFVTRDSKGLYYAGFEKDPLLDDDHKPCNDESYFDRLIKLEHPFKIDTTSEGGFWMSPQGEIYFSLKADPTKDKKKILVTKPNLEGITRPSEGFIRWLENISQETIN